MSYSKHLCNLKVCSIDKDQGRDWVDEDEALKLVRIQLPTGAIAHDTVCKNEEASKLNAFAQEAQSLLPARESLGPILFQVEGRAHGSCNRLVIRSELLRSDER